MPAWANGTPRTAGVNHQLPAINGFLSTDWYQMLSAECYVVMSGNCYGLFRLLISAGTCAIVCEVCRNILFFFHPFIADGPGLLFEVLGH